jgi:hypothetical protein
LEARTGGGTGRVGHPGEGGIMPGGTSLGGTSALTLAAADARVGGSGALKPPAVEASQTPESVSRQLRREPRRPPSLPARTDCVAALSRRRPDRAASSAGLTVTKAVAAR